MRGGAGRPGRRWGSRGLQSGGQSTETGRQRIRTPVNAATTVLILGDARTNNSDPRYDALRTIAAFRLALPRTILRFAGGREITLGELGTRQGLTGGINAIIVGNYLTTLGRPAESDLELLDDLQMPIKALNSTL